MRVYGGIRGQASFQFIYASDAGSFDSLLTMPEWYLLAFTLALLSIVGIVWPPLRIAVPPLILTLSLSLAYAGLNAAYAILDFRQSSKFSNLRHWILTTFLHLLQPLARLSGRVSAGLHPWRGKQTRRFKLPVPGDYSALCANWHQAEKKLQDFEDALRAQLSFVVGGGSFAAWDLEVRGGILGGKRIVMAIEDLGSNRQLIRVRWFPVFPVQVILFVSLFAAFALGAAIDHAFVASALLAIITFATSLRAGWEAGTITTLIEDLLKHPAKNSPP